jgi:OmpA-OmpF porin, OOP family
MRLVLLAFTLSLTCASLALHAVDLNKLPSLDDVKNKSLLDNVNKRLREQQIKDGQFEFKTGKAEFTAGNEKRVNGLLKIMTENSKTLKTTFPGLYVTSEGHTDADGTPDFNQMLSLARAKTVCGALKAKGMQITCKPIGLGSAKPLVAPEKSAADKQRNRRVLVQVAK